MIGKDLFLFRTRFTPVGVFGDLKNVHSQVLFKTLEHAYLDQGFWMPKVPRGTYRCVRGIHALHNGIPFETFEVTGVPGHQGILIHVGNSNDDSEGCILVGKTATQTDILQSRAAFTDFMQLQTGVDAFNLTVG